MELQQFADFFLPMTCILSVEVFPDGSYGNIRIVTGNRAYLDGTAYYKEVDSLEVYNKKFIPNMPYEYYIPKDLNFENFCYRCAILGETIHTYVSPDHYNFWINLIMLPVKSDKKNIGYCSYTQQFTKKADASMMVNISPEIANTVLKTCIKLKGASNFQETIDEIIQDIRDICDADHCCIFLTDFNQRKCSVLCEALSKNTTLKSMKVYVNDDFFDIVATWPATLAGSTCLIINDAHDWKELKQRNPAWCKSMTDAGAKSLVLFPLKARGETLGYIWAINFNTDHTMKIRETLELTTFFLASEISNYQLFHQMEMLSMTDLLTGVYNRNAMNHHIDMLISSENAAVRNVGIVFADLNGLKYVNDHDGHFAGDMLLKNAAVTLQRCFAGYEVYRAGGDEFMIIIPDLSETELSCLVERLHDLASKPDCVSFAVGYCLDTADHIQESIRLADERMYADKKAFYEKYPDQKRK